MKIGLLRWMFKKIDVAGIALAHNRDHWSVLVNEMFKTYEKLICRNLSCQHLRLVYLICVTYIVSSIFFTKLVQGIEGEIPMYQIRITDVSVYNNQSFYLLNIK